MPGHIAFERLKIILCRKDRVRESVPEMASSLKERLRKVLKAWVGMLYREGMRMCSKSCVACPP